ncbi:fimbrillin family protein [Dysgonomonas sp. Marseille-P4677]|nr:fimbrillin family protein [Dysgonomonas sp. Marseille-P4677]MBK5720632.1 fimbrillin family protein [Dysgonomonas sp. Marseille-P4677]
MKTNLLSIMMTVASFIFASCSSNDEPEVYDRKVKFSSGISANLAKVGGTDGNQWEGNESIGIYMVGNKTTDVAEGAQNIRYTTTSTGASATFTSTTPIYYPVNILSKVDFIAYHPTTPR